MKKVIGYIEPLWQDGNKKMSIRKVLSLIFSIDLVRNISYVIHKWEPGKSLAEATMLLGLEAGLIAALLSLTTFQTISTMNKTQNQTPSEPITM